MSKRHKRLFPKKYSASYVKTSRFDANKSAAYTAQRSKPTIGSGPDTLPKLDNNFMQEVPETRSLSTYDEDINEMVRSEKGKVEDRLYQLKAEERGNLLSLYRVWQNKRQQGVAEYYCTILERIGPNYKLMMFHSGMEFLFVQEYKNVRMISRTYYGRDKAMQHFHKKHFGWILAEEMQS